MKLEERVERLERLIQGLALELAELRRRQAADLPLSGGERRDGAAVRAFDETEAAEQASEGQQFPEHLLQTAPAQSPAGGGHRSMPGSAPRPAGPSGHAAAGGTLPLQAAPRPPAPPVDWEHLLGRVWLPRIFIVVLLLGVLWGFAAAVNAGMITRPVRCWLGAAAAACMFAAGIRQMRHKREALGQALLGGAHSLLVVTLFAAHMLYGFMSVPLACVLYGIAILLFGATALAYRSQSLMLLAMAAGCLIPFLLDYDAPHVSILVAYEGLFAASALLIGWKLQFRWVYAASYLLLQPALLVAALLGAGDGGEWWFLGAQLLQQAILLTAYLLEKREAPVYSERRGLVFTSFAITAGWAYLLLMPKHESQYLILVGIGAAVYSLLAWLQLSKKKEAAELLAVTATLGWMLLLLESLPGTYAGAALAVEGTLALAIGLRIRAPYQQGAGTIVLFIGAMRIIGKPIDAVASPETFSWIILLADLLVLHRIFLPYKQSPRARQASGALLWLTGVLGLAFLTQLTLAASRPLETDSQRLILSAVWVAYAIALIIAGIMLRRPKARFAGMLLVLLTLLKVIFIDVPGVTIAVRAILFIGLGVVGIAVSRVMYSKQKSQ
ncbi:hypothetical protein VE23_17740 [Paenibacillus sp. D9]|uniref:DUF2339 domain-containing protein n=1 Tax=Paenibacillus sp. D9 TaxID=665792 RepID=UPI00061E997E|nr:DUF2339 domain-containing protein [Paenibacillus sp. D9]KKC48512.1 hypothetical protein VE23_17740 [Paenibacillus sp. D9]